MLFNYWSSQNGDFSTPSVCVCVFSSELKPRCGTLLKLVTSIVTQMQLPGRKLMDCRTVAKLAKKHTARPLTPLSLTPLTMCCACLAFWFPILTTSHLTFREVQWQKCWKESGLASEQEAFAKSLNLKLIVLEWILKRYNIHSTLWINLLEDWLKILTKLKPHLKLVKLP